MEDKIFGFCAGIGGELKDCEICLMLSFDFICTVGLVNAE